MAGYGATKERIGLAAYVPRGNPSTRAASCKGSQWANQEMLLVGSNPLGPGRRKEQGFPLTIFRSLSLPLNDVAETKSLRPPAHTASPTLITYPPRALPRRDLVPPMTAHRRASCVVLDGFLGMTTADRRLLTTFIATAEARQANGHFLLPCAFGRRSRPPSHST